MRWNTVTRGPRAVPTPFGRLRLTRRSFENHFEELFEFTPISFNPTGMPDAAFQILAAGIYDD